MHLAVFMLAAAMQTPPPVPHVDAVGIVVRDIAAERRFYTRTFGFTDVGNRTIAGVRIECLALGNERLELVRYARAGAPIPSGAHSNDRTFQHVAIIVSDMERAWRRVRSAGIRPVSAAPQVLPRWNPNAGGISAVYFRDPEGHPLELLHFPAGKGAAPWLLGIDHTALAVTAPASSTRFYEKLGFAVCGHSNNYGIEQEPLSGRRAAHVQITALRLARLQASSFCTTSGPQGASRARARARTLSLPRGPSSSSRIPPRRVGAWAPFLAWSTGVCCAIPTGIMSSCHRPTRRRATRGARSRSGRCTDANPCG